MKPASLLIGLLIATCLVHWVSVVFLVRRGRLTEKPLVWNLLGLAVGLLAVQKSYMVVVQFIELNPPALSFVNVGLNLLVAGLLLGGILHLFPFLNLLQRNKELLAVIEERNVIIHQFHERIARALQKIQIAMEVGKPINFIIEQVAEMSLVLQVFLEDLKAGVLLGNKFEVALKTLVEDLGRDASFPITVHVDSTCEDNISREQGVEFLHIVREAIRNSVQHSQAKKGQVSASMTATDVILEVSDNGKGFEMDLVRVQGQGLGSMVNRAKKIGARLKIHSQSSKGTSVIIEVPLHGKPSDCEKKLPPSHSSMNAVQKIPVVSLLSF
jgi:two-component sensor histidine kinase